MLPHLDRKLWRDLSRMKGQALAVALVMACGLAMLIMARSLIHSLESTRAEYYRAHRFAEVFAHLKRAPLALMERVRAIPGVAIAQPGLSVQVTLDIPGLDEPASGNVRSLPDHGEPEHAMNQRSASAPCSSMSGMGSRMLPRCLLILRPSNNRCSPCTQCRTTSRPALALVCASSSS